MSAHNFFDLASVDSAALTDATPRPLGQVGLPENAIALVNVEVIMTRISDLAAKAWTLAALIKRQGGIVSVLESIPAPPNLFASVADQAALAAASIALFSDENTIGVNCTGLAGTETHWSVRINGRGIFQ